MPSESSPRLFVLSIAINEYQSDEVSNLGACVNDADRLYTTLTNRFEIAEANYLRLQNEEATRDAILAAFRTHFANLRDGDIALFHYSGHGSWEPTQQEFTEAGLEIEIGRNECLVVHDYEPDQVHNLADKELRYLIAEMQQDEDGQEKDVTFIAIMDCCFSGSIFRNDHPKKQVRRTNLGIKKARPLDQLLEGQYQEQLAINGKVTLPSVRYITLTACSPKESALENTKGGLFTQALCDRLALPTGDLPTYADLHFLLHHQIKEASDTTQHPFLEYSGQVNPYWQFLNHTQASRPDLVPIEEVKGEWKARIGALHGLDATAWKEADISVYVSTDTEHPVATARLESLELEHSVLKLNTSPSITDNSSQLLARIISSRLPIDVNITEKWEQMLWEAWQTTGLHHVLMPVAGAEVQLRATDQGVGLFLGAQLITGITDFTDEISREFLGESIRKYWRWQKCRQLLPPKNSTLDAKKIDLQLRFISDRGYTLETVVFPGAQSQGTNTLELPFINQQYYTFQAHLHCRSVSPLYLYLFYLGSDFKIKQVLDQFNKPLRYDERISYDSLTAGMGLGFSHPEQQVTTDTLLLVATHTRLTTPQTFEQKGLNNAYGRYLTPDEVGQFIRQDSIILRGRTTLPDWTVKRVDLVYTR